MVRDVLFLYKFHCVWAALTSLTIRRYRNAARPNCLYCDDRDSTEVCRSRIRLEVIIYILLSDSYVVCTTQERELCMRPPHRHQEHIPTRPLLTTFCMDTECIWHWVSLLYFYFFNELNEPSL